MPVLLRGESGRPGAAVLLAGGSAGLAVPVLPVAGSARPGVAELLCGGSAGLEMPVLLRGAGAAAEGLPPGAAPELAAATLLDAERFAPRWCALRRPAERHIIHVGPRRFGASDRRARLVRCAMPRQSHALASTPRTKIVAGACRWIFKASC